MRNQFTVKAIFAAILLAGPIFGFAQQAKVTVCHNGNTIQVSAASLPAHLAHGDVAGPCAGCIDPQLINPDAFCIQVYDPVCGCNGVTYSNGCYAANAGVTSWTSGPCGCINPALINPDQICIMLYAPVCGCDGNTYSNSCFASAAGVTSWTPGPCEIVLGSGKTSGPVFGKVLELNPTITDGPTMVRLLTAEDGLVIVRVYNLEGKLMSNVFEGTLSAGSLHEINLDASSFAPGIYLCQATGGGLNNAVKFVVE